MQTRRWFPRRKHQSQTQRFQAKQGTLTHLHSHSGYRPRGYVLHAGSPRSKAPRVSSAPARGAMRSPTRRRLCGPTMTSKLVRRCRRQSLPPPTVRSSYAPARCIRRASRRALCLTSATTCRRTARGVRAGRDARRVTGGGAHAKSHGRGLPHVFSHKASPERQQAHPSVNRCRHNFGPGTAPRFRAFYVSTNHVIVQDGKRNRHTDLGTQQT
jgi:hypothetical protein